MAPDHSSITTMSFLLYAAFIPTGNAKGIGIFQMSQKYSICSKRYKPRSACQPLCSWWVPLSNTHWGTLGLCKPAILPPQSWLSVSNPQKEKTGSVVFQLSFQESMDILRILHLISMTYMGQLYSKTIWQDSSKSNEKMYEENQNLSFHFPHNLGQGSWLSYVDSVALLWMWRWWY